MRVYRVEHPEDGHGPYGGANRIYSLNYAHQNDTRPNPQWEGLEMGYEDYCALSSMERLCEWFEGWWGQIRYYGFHIAVYEVSEEHVGQGKMQLVFTRNKAQLIYSMPVEENGELIAWLHSSSLKTTSPEPLPSSALTKSPTLEQSALAALLPEMWSDFGVAKEPPSAFLKTAKTSLTTTAAGLRSPTLTSFTVASPSSHLLTVSVCP